MPTTTEHKRTGKQGLWLVFMPRAWELTCYVIFLRMRGSGFDFDFYQLRLVLLPCKAPKYCMYKLQKGKFLVCCKWIPVNIVDQSIHIRNPCRALPCPAPTTTHPPTLAFPNALPARGSLHLIRMFASRKDRHCIGRKVHLARFA